jgi:hypothetical protein
MSQLLTTPTQAPAGPPPAQVDTDLTDPRLEARRRRLWTLIEALAYAGAFIDPSGILAVQRLRQAQEEERRHGRR